VKGKKLIMAAAALAVVAMIYAKAPELIGQKIKTEVNNLPLRVRALIAWRVLWAKI